MKHPTREQWMEYIYDELPPREKSEMGTHLDACPECQARVGEWRTTRASLDDWQILPQLRAGSRHVVLKWAAAAMLVLGVGFAMGRVSAPPSADLAAFRREMEQIAQETSAKLNAETLRVLKELQVQNANDYATLRKELETVAVLTEASLKQAQRQIVELAGHPPFQTNKQ